MFNLIKYFFLMILALRFLREQEDFKKKDKKKYIIWCDTGSDFIFQFWEIFFLKKCNLD